MFSERRAVAKTAGPAEALTYGSVQIAWGFE